ncbi:DUF6920 family protein [Thermostichus vulcanus]|uniref:Uncharacterized protein n=1 Tax=Thermostichus vulcanus str. 'Rupite' TaxID=2813851 RepID=A0ABT0C957_THEVL|nr:DUF6544 family protein [Thermostichus vulcanus]MCJ2542326.1 hypothetical protein [Thermostichus vulcanus str. 'Rupite']
MVRILGFVLLALVLFGLVAVWYGGSHWQAQTQALRSGLKTAPPSLACYDPQELEGLPPPVQRYFRAVLSEGQPLVHSVYIRHTGTFNLSENGDHWRPFTSTQWVTTQPPGFLWDAQIPMLPGVVARVHDAYIQGEGILHAALLGLIPLVHLQDRTETAAGELMRWFAETAWYPTALLPSQGVQWDPVDDSSAWATIRDGDLSLRLLFHFDAEGLIQTVRAEARGRAVGGEVIPTPWEGRWSAYERRQGMLVPTQGEVAWILADGAKPYWRGQITELAYEFNQ